MNIVFLNIYQGINFRGAERSTAVLCRRLARSQRVTLIQGGKNNIDNNYRIILLPVVFPRLSDTSSSFWRKFYLDAWSLQILFFTLLAVPFLLKTNFDILSPVNGGWQVIICRIISFLKRRKLLIIGRAGIGRDDAFNLRFRPDLFIALTKRGEDWANKKFPKVKTVCLPNGVNLLEFNRKITPVNPSLKEPLIVTAASLTKNKNLDFTIKAVAGMKTKASLLIIGKGSEFENLNAEGEKLLGKNRFKIINADFAGMAQLYKAGKIFTLASQEEEAFGNVYLEALACNLPVVAPAGYRREIIGPAGLYFQSGDLSEYAAKLDAALDLNFKDLPVIQAEKFSWDNLIRRYENAFLELIAKKDK